MRFFQFNVLYMWLVYGMNANAVRQPSQLAAPHPFAYGMDLNIEIWHCDTRAFQWVSTYILMLLVFG